MSLLDDNTSLRFSKDMYWVTKEPPRLCINKTKLNIDAKNPKSSDSMILLFSSNIKPTKASSNTAKLANIE